ncbi:MAG: ATP-dependent helicase HrpB [Planctomycetota bacterium]|nr:ATP-dependent helicase HrpB [Planctomycetota bacterium]
MPAIPLPIDAVLPELVAALRANPAVVLKAPTGAGKTTRVPPALLDAGLAGRGQVLMLEPRRLAARAAARRIAFERGAQIGGEVGYHVRFERKASRATRILVVTEGLLVRYLQDDPFLSDVGALVFDEFHERSLHVDLALALARRVQQDGRPDLKIVVMSATLRTARLAEWLGDAPIVESAGRLFPVDVSYLEREPDRFVDREVALGVEQALARTDGDVLAFLPGVGEIRRTRDALAVFAERRGVRIHELYGDLPAEEQDAVLRPGDRRKVILATNVAETSVTVEGVTAVVDSGLARRSRFDASVGLDRLELVRISRSSADQRMGRAGRTQPGICLRLWTEGVQRSLQDEDDPEIRRVDLAGPVLQLLAFGERDPRTFPWFEAPPSAALDSAISLLSRLGALDVNGITELGRALSRFGAAPRLARLLAEGHRLGCLGDVALAAAMLQERDPFLRHPSQRNARRSDSDVVDRIRALRAFARGSSSPSAPGEVNASAARFVLRAAEELCREAVRALGEPARDEHDEEATMRALLAAWPDRLARRREEGSRRAVMEGGRGVRLADESGVVDHDLFVCVDLDGGERGERAEALVRQASAVDRAWLDPKLLRSESGVRFDAATGRVRALRRTTWNGLVLDEVETGAASEDDVAEALAEAASEDLPRFLPLEHPETAAFLGRIRSLRAWIPELGLPAYDDAELRALLPDFARGCRSLADLKKKDLATFLSERLPWDQRRALDEAAPERLLVPSGNQIRLAYEPGRPPVLAARIQELFGLAETPRVARGRVRVVVHLLAPNGRPQQVTDDLASFWNGAYFEVRKELRTRYPRHSWPEDPWNAPPEKRPRRRS